MKKAMIALVILSVCCLFAGCSEETECAHQFSTTTVSEATCQKEGSLNLTCTLCGITYTQTTPTADHNFAEELTAAATCSQEGILTTACTVCGSSENKTVPPTAHQFDLYSLNPSTCTVCQQTVEGGAADPENPWYGKNWVALGTSLTSKEQGKYVEPLAERTGLNVTNLGIPGGTAVDAILESANSADLSQADLITVEFGVNDWFANIPLGSLGDTETYVATTNEENGEVTEEGSFAGTCYQIFSTLQKRAPGAVVVFISEPTGQHVVATGENCGYEQKNHEGLLQGYYTEMAMATARYMGIPVIDAGSRSMINQQHPQYLADQIHHSDLGGKQYALAIWMELKNIAPLLKSE